jgi:hypothetical protein
LVPHSAEIVGLTDEQRNAAVANFEDLGPVPRICIHFARDPRLLIDYENHRQAMITGLTSQSLQHFVLSGGTVNLDAESHAIFLVRRQEVDVLERAYIEPVSEKVEMLLMTTINDLQRLERVNLYHTFASVNTTKMVAGLLYESLGHTLIREGITLTLKPMIKLSPSRQRKLFHWKSQGEERTSISMDQDDSEMSVEFPPETEITYEESKLKSVEPNHLYVPKARNQVALDSFFKLGGFLYIFQFAVSKKHDIKNGIEVSLSRLQNILPPKANWRFVFITPPDCEVDVKSTSVVEEFLEGVTLYSAHLEIERRMKLNAPS